MIKGNINYIKKNRKRLRRPCSKCGNTFKPVSRFNNVCNSCQEKGMILRRIKLLKNSMERIMKDSIEQKEEKWYKNISKSLDLVNESIKLQKENK